MRTRYIVLLSLILSAVVINGAQATQNENSEMVADAKEIVVTANRVATESREIGSSTTIISAEELESKHVVSVLEALRGAPSLDVVQSGGIGSVASVFIRGAKSEHTLILVDGVVMNDPITPGRSYDFANLTVDNIERIEIIRGPQSTIYGSDAIGGVINIITKRGKGKPGYSVTAEGGSYDTYRVSGNVSGSAGLADYSLGVTKMESGGISAASEKDGNSEKDGYENMSVSGRLGLAVADNAMVDFVLKYIEAKNDNDNGGGAGQDDPNHTTDAKQLFFKAGLWLALLNDMWEQELSFSFSSHERETRNDTDPDHPVDSLVNTFDSKINKVNWQHVLNIHNTNTLTLGVETAEEQGDSSLDSQSSYGPYASVFEKKKATITGYYAQDQIRLWDRLFITPGVRVDNHDKFGSEITYRVAVAYLLDSSGTKFKATYGTGFKAPSLYQLYSDYGVESLLPEKSAGWDIGVEQSLLEGALTLSATYFDNKLENLIDFDNDTFTFMNIAEAKTSGVELAASFIASSDLVIKANYSNTNTEDKATGEKLLRRAQSKFGMNANYRFNGKGNVNVSVVHVGEREDLDFSSWPASRVTLDAYTLVNMAASYEVMKGIKVFGRVENLLDQDYEEVLGYGSPGASVYVGATMTL